LHKNIYRVKRLKRNEAQRGPIKAFDVVLGGSQSWQRVKRKRLRKKKKLKGFLRKTHAPPEKKASKDQEAHQRNKNHQEKEKVGSEHACGTEKHRPTKPKVSQGSRTRMDWGEQPRGKATKAQP